MSYVAVFYSGVRLYVESPSSSVAAVQGSNVTLPCHYRYEPEIKTPRRTRVKWFRVDASDGSREEDVMVAIGARLRSYGGYQGRVRLRRDAPGDASLIINSLNVDDTGFYRCEVIDGLEDESVTVELEFRGIPVRHPALFITSHNIGYQYKHLLLIHFVRLLAKHQL